MTPAPLRAATLRGQIGAGKRRGMVMALAALALFALFAATAARATFQPQELWVEGGEEAWHSTPRFALHWANPPGTADVRYRLLDPSGREVIGDTALGWPATTIPNLEVPEIPGRYTAEVSLLDAGGNPGPPEAAKLRFDDTQPGAATPRPGPAWIGRNAFPYRLRIAHPTGPEPPSGIRGYAVDIDGSADGAPCAAPSTCDEAETDLRGGVELDSLEIAGLPEGTSYVHALAVSGSGMKSAQAGTSVLRVDETDPVTTLSGAPTGWSNAPVHLTATASDAASGMGPGGGGTPFTAIAVDGGAPKVGLGDSSTTTLVESGVHTVAYYARDSAGNVADGGTANGKPNHEPAVATVRIDRDPPALAFSNAQNPAEPELVEASVRDGLSGVDPTRGGIAVRRAGPKARFVELASWLGDGRLRARWDSDSYPPGEYEFRATAYDRAGNASVTSSRANGAAMALRNPLKISTALRASLAGLGQRTVRYGSGALLGGRLIAGRRAPLAATPVRVVERFAPGSGVRERSTTTLTDRRGDFRVHLAPGPSREVLAVAPPTATLSGSTSQPTRLSVRGGLRLGASSAVATVGGRPIVFRGRVLGEIPGGGKAVQLQFRLPGLPWSQFRTIRSDSRGRFRYAYRFVDDDSRGARFRFRAFAPAQSGWPYGPAASNPVFVRGR